jgi:hypothetical protein
VSLLFSRYSGQLLSIVSITPTYSFLGRKKSSSPPLPPSSFRLNL